MVDEIVFHSANDIFSEIVNQLRAEIPGAGINSQKMEPIDETPSPTPPIITPPITAAVTANPTITALLQTMVSSMDATRAQIRQAQVQVS